MSEVLNDNYWGLPIPNDEELFTLQFFQFNQEEALNPTALGQAIVMRNPNIWMVIRHDTDFWANNEAPRDLTDEEKEEFGIGIESGYVFAIGAITGIRYLRSGKTDIQEFFRDATPSDVLIFGEREKERMIEVRSGKAIIDKTNPDRAINDSSDLPFVDAGDYIFESIPFETLMESEIEMIRKMLAHNFGNEDDRIDAHVEGFRHGVASAIEMHLQATEEQIIMRLEQNRWD